MSVKNLHSLFTSKWFINEDYGKALMPSLFSILKGTATLPGPDKNIIQSATSTGITGASLFDDDTNKEQYVAVVGIKSPIYKYSQECGPVGTKYMARTMQRLEQDENCAGIVLDIDSGGGQVSGTPEFHDFIKNFTKPVVAYTDGLMCSAAYYIGAATNHIVANNRADAIGSIGTMIHFVNMQPYLEKKGMKVVTEYATESTEKNREFEDLLAGNPETYIKKVLDPINTTFINDIKNARANVNEDVFKGAVYNAADSLEKGLIDEIGTMQTAINKVFALKQENSKPNNNMSTQRANVQAVLELDGPLATADNNGSYLNNEQLDAIETQMQNDADAIADLNNQLEAANNNTDLQDQLTTANNQVSAVETTVDAILQEAGVEASGSLEEKLTALQNRVVEMGAKDGARPSKTKIDAKENTGKVLELDPEASHNKIADQI